MISTQWLLTSIKVFGCTLRVGEGTSVEFVNLAGVATVLFDVSEFVALVEAVPLSELTTEVATEFDVAVTVELATEVDAVAVAASELCEAGDVDTAGALAFATSLVAAGAETVELGVTGKAASPPKISAAVAG